jgi:transposase
MLKDDLLLCGQLDPKAINEMATSYGGMVLRIPPYHCHLNPIEHYWVHLKDQLRELLVPNDNLDAERCSSLPASTALATSSIASARKSGTSPG